MKSKKAKIIFIGCFLSYLIVFFVGILFGEDKKFSDLENRYLSSKPKFSLKSLVNREYGDKLEKYIADQFPLRDEFISIKAISEYTIRKKENNGVYLGKNGYLIEKFLSIKTEQVERNINYINSFADEYNTSVLLAPTSLELYSDKVPKYAQDLDEGYIIDELKKQFNESVRFVDVRDVLDSNRDKNLYYKTDHHWTTTGAYYAYCEFMETLGLSSLRLDDFSIEQVSDNFYGTLFSKGNFTFVKPDTIEMYKHKKDISVEVDYVDENKVTDTLYEYSYLDKKDKYGFFIDNNHPLVKIKTGAETGRKIAIIKDSYAHSFVPFLIGHFDEIHMIDLRMYKQSVKEYLDKEKINDVLFLYNIRNFVIDKDIIRVTK